MNPLAYAAQTDNDTTKQAAPDATANDSDRGPATHVSISQAMQDFAAAGWQWGQDRLSSVEAMGETIQQRLKVHQLNHQMREIEWQEETNKHFADAIQRAQDNLDKWMNATPVPAVQLTKAQIAEVLKKAAPLGFDPSKIDSADNYIFVIDDKQYTFKKDGTAWMREAGVPTSEAEKLGSIKIFTDSIQRMSSRIQDTSDMREALTAQLNALSGQ